MNQIINSIVYLAFAILVAGCNTDGNEDATIYENGILIEVEAPQLNGWGTEENSYTRSGEAISIQQKGEDGLDMEVDLLPDTARTFTDKVTTRWTNMDDNTVFRVVAYACESAATITTSNYKGYGDYKLLTDGTVQTVKSLTLPIGTYTFVCYSNGDSTALPAFSNNATSITATNGINFMTCVKPNIVIDNTGSIYTLSNIEFTHNCVRYRVSAAAQSERMANITACAATLTLPANSATYSFTSNAFTANSTAETIALVWNSPNAMTVHSNYVYLLPQSGKNLTVKLNLTIGGKAFNDKSTTLTGITFTANGTYCSSVSFTTTKGYIVGGNIWANGNLYRAAVSSGAYDFYPNTMSCSKGNYASDYFTYNNPYPSNSELITTWSDSRDPCRLVSPTNTWRTPTVQDCNALLQTGVVQKTDRTIYGGVLNLPFTSFMRYHTGYPHEPYFDHIGYYLTTTYTRCLQNGGIGEYSVDETLAFAVRCVRN
ncbi:hypothetical protein [Bacteroides sp.]|uniref:hypothetical protein n=1 Tax=Bacteroides sp. TaxID=29523 RepID=UPI0026261A08|nr:hypothetical protein [Bacteroides sp.]